MMRRKTLGLMVGSLLVVPFVCIAGISGEPKAISAQANSMLAGRIEKILARPECKHALFGIEFYSLDSKKVLYSLNSDKLFLPASTTKLMTEGTALNLLGPDFRFHTRVYRTGSISKDGTLDGDLILVASGDPNLSARVQANDTLAFENWDHSLSGNPATKAVPGDPLIVLRNIAAQVSKHGIKKVTGRVLIDTSLFPEGQREPGTGTSISPIVVNDNLVDITIGPGKETSAAAAFTLSPDTSYVRFINHVKTGKADSHVEIGEESDQGNPDGSRTVTVTGSFPLGATPLLYSYPVPVPSRFAAISLVSALEKEGVQAQVSNADEKIDFKKLASDYTEGNLVAEHVSPPFSEDVKVTLKVSQNLHAAMTPFILGATLGDKSVAADQAGFDLERKFLQKAGLDLGGAVQSAGEGNPSYFSPDFVVHYLTYMTTTKNYQIFFNALPVLNKDGTLYKILPGSPAEGHIYAKTGTTGMEDKLNRKLMITAKGLCGYETTASGEHLAFAIYTNNFSVEPSPFEESTTQVGSMLAELAAAAYDVH
jgi:D-alanyl-D-alanine carboxypeptidase/D-alanyl-D-alanine-endopeptidase (penicillin-binding protein 4)